MNKELPAVFSRIHSALRRRGAEQDADDYIQEAYARLVVYEREKVVLEPEAFLMRTAINLSIDAHRASVVHGEQVVLEDVVLVDDAPPVESVIWAVSAWCGSNNAWPAWARSRATFCWRTGSTG